MKEIDDLERKLKEQAEKAKQKLKELPTLDDLKDKVVETWRKL